MIVLDSNIWIALFNESDASHARAEELARDFSFPLLLPEHVLVEVVTVLGRKVGKQVADTFLHRVRDNQNIEILFSNVDFLVSVVSRFLDRRSMSLSFVDVYLLELAHTFDVVTFDRALEWAITRERTRKRP